MTLVPGDAFAAETFIERENGRFVVYLEVHFWEGDNPDKVATYRHRIQDYATRKQAEVATKWILVGTNRDSKFPIG
jgi:hypothetical protein